MIKPLLDSWREAKRRALELRIELLSSHKLLVVHHGDFSGAKASMVSALRAGGCEVVEVRHSLRYLRLRALYLLLILMNSVMMYGVRFKRHIRHTPIFDWVQARATEAIIRKYRDVDLVISMPRIVRSFTGKRVNGVRYSILTDHVNLLSKKAPDFGFESPERGTSDRWQDVEKAALRQQDHLFVFSTHVKKSMIEDYGIDASRISVVHAGPNLDVDAERDGVVKDYTKKNILFVGLDPDRKGLPALILAFESVKRRFPDARLNVAGVDGPSGGGIIYHGEVRGEALRELFYDAQIFALPSLREPFGIVFLEAMWSKAVCIGTTQGAMPELIEQGRTGYVVEPQDSETLADRIIELFDDPSRLERMAEAGYRVARERYSWKRSAQLLLSALKDSDAAREDPADQSDTSKLRVA